MKIIFIIFFLFIAVSCNDPKEKSLPQEEVKKLSDFLKSAKRPIVITVSYHDTFSELYYSYTLLAADGNVLYLENSNLSLPDLIK